jgi:hypothetical protein
MNIAVWLVFFGVLAPIGPGYAQGTMSGMTNSMRSSPLTAPAGQGQGPHDIGKELTAEDRILSGNGEGRSDSMPGADSGNSSGTAGGGMGADTSSGQGRSGEEKKARPWK